MLSAKPAQAASAAGCEASASCGCEEKAQLLRQPAPPIGVGLDTIASQLNGNQSVPWSIVIGLTLLTLLPALLLSMTPMVRLLVVFHFLRQALGTQTAPSNQVLMGLGLMMTWFLMQPVMLQVDQQALTPYRAGAISGEQAMDLGAAPVKTYMLRYAREKDLALFASAGMAARPQDRCRPAHAGGGSGLHAERIEGRIPDWRGAVSALPAGGYGDRQHHDVRWHDAVAAGGDLDAGEDPAVCDGGWMEPAGGLVAEEFLAGVRESSNAGP